MFNTPFFCVQIIWDTMFFRYTYLNEYQAGCPKAHEIHEKYDPHLNGRIYKLGEWNIIRLIWRFR